MPDLLDRLRTALQGRYEIERELGRGGMSVVYLAKDLRHHRHVAVKVLRSELTASIAGERFLREIEIEASLRHPHILPLFDSGQADLSSRLRHIGRQINDCVKSLRPHDVHLHATTESLASQMRKTDLKQSVTAIPYPTRPCAIRREHGSPPKA